MPDYQVTDPHTGLMLQVSGPTPPSEAVLRQLFADAAKKSGTSSNDPAYRPAANQAAAAALGLHGDTVREQPHMGPISPDDAGPFTLADLIDNPKLSLQRMAAALRRDITDPRVVLPAVLGVAGAALRGSGIGTGSVPVEAAEVAPKANAAARPGIIEAIRQNVNPDDVVEAIPGAKTAKAGYRVVRQVQKAVQQTRSAPPAPPEAPPTTLPSAATPAPASAAPPAQAPAATAAPPSPVESGSGFPSLEELHLTPSEITQAVKWHESGVKPEVILHRILQSRQLTARTGTETPDQARIKVEYRNQHGRWQDEK